MKKYFDYLEQLRQSGETNMFGAVPYLQKKFPELSGQDQAVKILQAWMDSYEPSRTQKESGASPTEADALFLFGDFIDDLAAHLSGKEPEEKCTLCVRRGMSDKSGCFLYCARGIKEYLLDQARKYRDRMESCCKIYFDYLDHLNSLETYDQYTAEQALKEEFPYLESHPEHAKYAMASWMLKHN